MASGTRKVLICPMERKIIAMIPARAGSKGIKGKNKFPILNKPMIEYTVEAALESKYLSAIHINTDCEAIKAICQKYPVDCSYQRPERLSTDTSSTTDTVMAWINAVESKPDIIVLLQPTSPLRTSMLIDKAVKKFIKKGCKSLVGVHPMTEHPYKSINTNQENWSYLAKPDENIVRRQDYDKDYYTINGSIYIVDVSWFLKRKTFVKEGETQLFITSREEGIDVDELLDIYYVEAILNHRKESQR